MTCIRGGWEGGGLGRWWAAGGRLYPLLGLFGVTMSPRSASPRSRYALKGLRGVILPQEQIQTHAVHIVPLHRPRCLSHDFTWSAKLALEKQTSQLSLVMTLNG